MSTTTLIRGSLRETQEDGSRTDPRCEVCNLPSRLQDLLRDLWFNGSVGQTLSVPSIAARLNEEARADGIELRLDRHKLHRHLRSHATTDVKVVHALHGANRGLTRVQTKGVPVSILETVPTALEPGLPAALIPEHLSNHIESCERILDMLERTIDGEVENPVMAKQSAIAAYGYVSTVLRNHYWTLHRICDPRRMVTVFLAKVLRELGKDVAVLAQRKFATMASDCASEPDHDRWQDWIVRHGTEFADGLDDLARRYDAELLKLASEENP